MSAPSTQYKTARRYRINPLELLIFSLVTAGFGFSVYHLFKESENLHLATLQPMQTQPNRKVPNRAIAGTLPTVNAVVDGVAPIPHRIDFEVNCAENPGFQFGDQVCPTNPASGRSYPDTSKHHPFRSR
jgi:hypothetical protein